jgi:two-component system, chemotaxis family, sensor kinase CheA
VADDSITTRTLEKNILEAAGYRVRVAADGAEAWTALQSEPCSLLVSDVNMPRLNGFELTEKVRGSETLKALPIILVTSLDSREDRERGIWAGADAYIVKGAFDQDVLLSTIRQLI